MENVIKYYGICWTGLQVMRFDDPGKRNRARSGDMDSEERKQEILQDLLEENKKDNKFTPETDWAEQAQEDMLDWIESQGIYIRQ
jgi:hypothetical protein